MIAFATASLRAMLTGAGFELGIKTAIAAGAGFFGLGLVVGELARRVVEESVEIGLSETQTQESNTEH